MGNFDYLQISILKELLDELFLASKDDRKKIHELEWADIENNYSILGSIELKSGDIFGIASRLTKTGLVMDASQKEICSRSLYEDERIKFWLIENGESFKSFSKYVFSLESFRGTLNS